MTVEHMSFRGNYCLSLTPGAWLIVSLSTHNHLKKAKLDYVEYQVRVLNKKNLPTVTNSGQSTCVVIRSFIFVFLHL
jgi:hypothetical protein